VPPGPRGNLFLGSIAEIRRDNVLAFLDAWRRYGDTVRFRGPLTLYLLAHPDAVKHVLQDKAANYPRPPFVRDRLQAIVGGGLVGAEGAGWVRSRRMAQPAFRRHSLEGYGRQFVEATAEALDSWAADADTGRPLEVESEMVRISLANLAASLFQADWRRDIDRLGPAVGDILAFANSALTSVVDTARLPLPSTRRFERRLAQLDAFLYPLIAERRRSPGGQDLVSMLVEVTDEETGAGLTDKQVRDETISFFIAGHATIASALTWTWYLLSARPAEVEAAVTLRPRAPMLMRVDRVGVSWR
jgi:cytochrome P450